MDIQKGVIVSRTNLVDAKKEASLPWKGAILVIIFTLAVWAGAYFYNDKVKKEVTVLQNSLSELKQGRDYTKIATVADSESRLTSINEIMADRVNWDNLFLKIEENTLPEVTFTNLEAGLYEEPGGAALSNPAGAEGQKIRISLKGNTIGLNNLSKQMLAFEGVAGDKTEPLIKDLKVGKIDIKKTESGEVEANKALEFSIEGYINPVIVKNNFSSSEQ